MSNFEKACEQYEIAPPFANILSVKDAKLAFLDAMKKSTTLSSKLTRKETLIRK
ncbi:hypothetical protein LRB66_04895 [Borreliella burgdorferi]|uniref:hypothetical protein n=1 Tax=Borreliella burgdorferi TaxID=139 RepID=UPI00016C5604|nr:hypothetical protein [Borreliella burgdorferi]MCD2399540.1 hypothetical protein [Borreliella burgdorferi]MCD2411277.1 hypothetical protein [Borreliella burgdorferi]MCD2414846.1 hypothetical protein [Borreliella burgdorferi]MCR8876433.1 hypothetical protein [Borreliella burgdorferi]